MKLPAYFSGVSGLISRGPAAGNDFDCAKRHNVMGHSSKRLHGLPSLSAMAGARLIFWTEQNHARVSRLTGTNALRFWPAQANP
jgi:hypothetical protein